MSKNSKMPPMPNKPPKRGWIKQETKNEIYGILFILVGIFILVGLISKINYTSVLGKIGDVISGVTIFLFGNIISFVVPILFLVWGVIFALGLRPERNFIKICGAVLLVSSLCALLGLQCYGADSEVCIRWGGIIGAFLTNAEGLKVTKYVGLLGAYLIFSGFLVISVLLTTDFLFINFFRSLFKRYMQYREEKRKLNPKLDIDFERGAADIITTTKHTAEDKELPIIPKIKPSKPKIIDNRVLRTDKEKQEKVEKFEVPEKKDLSKMKQTQEELDLFQGYQMPSLNILSQPSKTEYKMEEKELFEISNNLEQTLRNFGIAAEVVQVTQGPVITRFELQPAPGIKVNRIVGLANDISMVLKAQHHVRILAPIPGKGVVGIEVPNKKRNQVLLREILSSDISLNHPSPLAMGLGKTISGEPYVCDLATMPHLLIAGATGAGKSVCLNSIIASFLFRNPPDKVKLMLIDPKRVEFNVYQAIPHLISPVVSDARKAAAALNWAVEHMEERYKKLASVNVRHIDSYNQMVTNIEQTPVKMLGGDHDFMPHIVIIIDELADLMLVAKADVEENITRIAQLARAVGMHLIIATQRPSVNVITGIIKANFPTRIAFQVSSKVDSRTILDTNGAEALIGKGDMLFSPGGAPKPIRVQGSYVSDEEIEHLVEFIKNQEKARYLKNDFTVDQKQKSKVAGFSGGGGNYSGSDDGLEDRIDEDLFREAVILILENRKASVSLIQRRLKIGYARAGRLMDMMEDAGIVGENKGSKPREIIVDPTQYLLNMKNEEIFDLDEQQRLESDVEPDEEE